MQIVMVFHPPLPVMMSWDRKDLFQRHLTGQNLFLLFHHSNVHLSNYMTGDSNCGYIKSSLEEIRIDMGPQVPLMSNEHPFENVLPPLQGSSNTDDTRDKFLSY